jgi:asparagine synthase (glutamine-hydrolysing)
MCGIAGIFGYHHSAPAIDAEELLAIREAMSNRGPDGAASWKSTDGRIGLAHRRLSIIDLSDGGAQPMRSADGNLVITFNGEIYNYRALQDGLRARGIELRSDSDTEVLLHLYTQHGTEMVHLLRGMYAFAIWDARRKGLFLARDALGIKPLYFADDGRSFRFASQVKALLEGGGPIDRRPDAAGYVGFGLWGHVPEPYTMYRGIRAVPAGCTQWIDTSGVRSPVRFYDVASILKEGDQKPVDLSPSDRRERVRALLLDSVRHHLVADVPVGVFLSSGVDSATLTALITECGHRPRTVTLGFNEFKGTESDEVPIAERVAAKYGAVHTTVRVEQRDFVDDMERLLNAMDQPSIDGVNCYFVSKAAASVGLKVSVTGIGGDELFRGYSAFREIPRLVRFVGPASWVPGSAAAFRALLSPLTRGLISPKWGELLELGGTYGGAYLLRRGLYTRHELAKRYGRQFLRDGLGELQTIWRLDRYIAGLGRARISALEIGWYMRNQLLRDADWAGMAHSLEIRVPFVDAHLLRSLAPLLTSSNPPGKKDVAESPLDLLPPEVTNRRKTGFSIPVRQWLSGPDAPADRGLRGWASKLLARWPRPSPNDAPSERRTVLVFRSGQLGDTLVSLPALRALRQEHRGDRLVLLTDIHPGKSYVSSWDIIAPANWFDDVIFYESGSAGWSRVKTIRALVLQLRDLSPSIVYSLMPPRNRRQNFRDRFFFHRIVGAPEVRDLGVHESYAQPRGAPLSRVAPEWRRLRGIVPTTDEDTFDLSRLIPRQDLDKADQLMERIAAGRSARLIALAPGSNMPAKVWPVERYVELGRQMLNAFPDVEFVVIGGKEDRAVGDKLREELDARVHNVAGELSVFGSAAVLRKCVGYVGNDTGVMHLAAMLGLPCVALFSARDRPGRWEPYGSNHTVLRKEVDCAGCMLKVCTKENNKCMRLISVEETFAASRKLVTEARP